LPGTLPRGFEEAGKTVGSPVANAFYFGEQTMTSSDILSGFASALLSGAVKVVDLSAPLGPDTPVLYLPPQFGKNTPKVKVHTISEYNQDGPLWAWNWLELGEHTGGVAVTGANWATDEFETYLAPGESVYLLLGRVDCGGALANVAPDARVTLLVSATPM